MRYCPTCEKPYPENDFNCPVCGYSPSKESTGELGVEQTQEIRAKNIQPQQNINTAATASVKKPPLKKPIVWAGGLGIILILGLFAFLMVRSGPNNSSEYRSNVTKIWRETIRNSDKIISKAKKVKDKADLNSFADDIDDFTNEAKEHKNDLADLDVPQEFDKAHRKLVDSYDELDSYFEGIYSLVSEDAQQLKLKDFVPVTKAGKETKASFDTALKDLDFLDNLPAGLFKLNARIKPIYKAIWKENKANKLKAAQLAKEAEEKKKAEALKQQQLKQQKQLEQNINQAESVVRNFLSAYISSSSTSRMRSYLSGEALSQFKPDIEFQGDFDHVGYSVVSRELTPLKNYRFYVHIKSKDWEGIYFSDKYKFVVGKVGSSYKIIRRQYIDRVN